MRPGCHGRRGGRESERERGRNYLLVEEWKRTHDGWRRRVVTLKGIGLGVVMPEIEIREISPSLSFSSRESRPRAESRQSLWFSWNLNGVSRIAAWDVGILLERGSRPIKRGGLRPSGPGSPSGNESHRRFDATSRALALFTAFRVMLNTSPLYNARHPFARELPHVCPRFTICVYLSIAGRDRVYRSRGWISRVRNIFLSIDGNVCSRWRWIDLLVLRRDRGDKYLSRASVHHVECGVSLGFQVVRVGRRRMRAGWARRASEIWCVYLRSDTSSLTSRHADNPRLRQTPCVASHLIAARAIHHVWVM